MVTFISEQDYQTAEANGIDRLLVYRRVYECGWDAERAITEPVNEKHRPTGEWAKWKAVAVVTHGTFRIRRSRGWTEEHAALTPAKKARGRSVCSA